MRRFIELIESANQGPVVLYHITDNPRFELNPDYEPEDNSIAIFDRTGHKGIYLTRDVEPWVNGHNYIRPFVAEILADPSALEHDRVGRWSGEIFIPASQFDKLKVLRVVPLDALCREHFAEYGWLEGSLAREFDTGNEIKPRAWNEPYRTPFPNYRYPHDVRDLSDDDVGKLVSHAKAGHEARLKYR